MRRAQKVERYGHEDRVNERDPAAKRTSLKPLVGHKHAHDIADCKQHDERIENAKRGAANVGKESEVGGQNQQKPAQKEKRTNVVPFGLVTSGFSAHGSRGLNPLESPKSTFGSNSNRRIPLKFINFCRRDAPAIVHLGCILKTGQLDITQAITDGILRFPQVVHTIEDVLHIQDGLKTLEKAIQDLGDAPVGAQTIPFSGPGVILKSPILNPQKVIGIGLNYRDHAEEAKIPIPKSPLIFGMYANAIIGPEEAIVIPPATNQVDYEAELAVVIGTRARRVSVEQAL